MDLLCDGDEDCPAPAAPLPFKSKPEIPTGRITAGINRNQFSTVQGNVFVSNKQYRYNKVRVTWVSKDGTEFNGEQIREIKPMVSENLFDCDVQLGAAASGNNIFQCGILITNTRAQFIRPPPARDTMTVTEGTQDVELHFSIQAVYETPEEEALPFMLGIEEVTEGGISLGAHAREDAQKIFDGTTKNERYKMPTVT